MLLLSAGGRFILRADGGTSVLSNCFDELDAPVELVASEDVPMPYNHTLELAVQPSVDKVVQAVRKVMYLE